MSDINSVTIIGRLTRNAELKYTTTGTAICNFSVALNKRYGSGDQKKESVHFFNIVLWGKAGEALSQYLTKGKQVGITGELDQQRWEKDGQQHSQVKITAKTVQFLSNPKNESGAGKSTDSQGSTPPSTDDFQDDIPF